MAYRFRSGFDIVGHSSNGVGRALTQREVHANKAEAGHDVVACPFINLSCQHCDKDRRKNPI